MNDDSKKILLDKLNRIYEDRYDRYLKFEEEHIEADKALIEYINDPEISDSYNKIYKSYS